MPHDDLIYEIEERIAKAQSRFGNFASTHEALGVAVEEWDEFRSAIRSNNFEEIEHEACDLAAVLIRIARDIRNNEDTQKRSAK
jgi:NTP pyrophosphatase (non-canonical NTP hydrolase)